MKPNHCKMVFLVSHSPKILPTDKLPKEKRVLSSDVLFGSTFSHAFLLKIVKINSNDKNSQVSYHTRNTESFCELVCICRFSKNGLFRKKFNHEAFDLSLNNEFWRHCNFSEYKAQLERSNVILTRFI